MGNRHILVNISNNKTEARANARASVFYRAYKPYPPIMARVAGAAVAAGEVGVVTPFGTESASIGAFWRALCPVF